MKKSLIISITAIALALGAAYAWAGPWGHGPGFAYGNQCPFWGGAPGAYQAPNQADIDKWRQDHAKFMEDTLELRKELAGKSMELRTLLAQPSPDQEKVNALNSRIAEIRSELIKKSGNLASRGYGYGPGYGHGYRRGPGGGYGPCWR